MAKILDKTSPAIELVCKALNVLKERKEILYYKIKKSLSRKDLRDLYFEVKFQNSHSIFELRVSVINQKISVLTEKFNKMRFDLGTDYITPQTVANLISLKIPNLIKHKSNQDGISEEKRYVYVVLDGLKKDGLIDDYEISLENQDYYNGIDCFVTYKGRKIPIQGKSSKKAQDKHELHFPNVPSILLKNYGESTLRQRTMEIVRKYYYEGKVIHAR